MTDARSIGPAGFHGSRVQTANGENHSATDSSVQISTRSIWKTVDHRHGNPPAERHATETKAMPYHLFYAQAHFFLTENVLGSRVEGCPCIPWPHLTDRKAIGIDISLSIHRDPPLLLFLLHHTIKSHIIKAFTSILTPKYNKKTHSQAPSPFSPLPRLGIQNRQLKLHRLCCVTNPTQAFLNKKDMLHHLIPDYR